MLWKTPDELLANPAVSMKILNTFLLKSLSQFGKKQKTVVIDHVSWVQRIEEPAKCFQFSI